jgi:hypothetical protein
MHDGTGTLQKSGQAESAAGIPNDAEILGKK